MLNFNYDNKTYNLPEDWTEVKFKNFIRVSKINHTHSLIPFPEELLLTALLEALCEVPAGEFDDMPIGQLRTLGEQIQAFNQALPASTTTEWMVDGQLYSYNTSFDSNSSSDVADIRITEQRFTNQFDHLPKIAAILIRPATKMVSPGGVSYNQLVKRTMVDVAKNEEVVANLPAYEVMQAVVFFSNGLIESINNTKSFS